MSVDAILAERGKRYGDFMRQAEITHDLVQVMAKAGADIDFDMSEALYMIAVKIARILNGDPSYVDNWEDIAGYATLVAKRLKAGGQTK